MNVIVTTQIQCVETTSFDLAHTYTQVQNFTIEHHSPFPKTQVNCKKGKLWMTYTCTSMLKVKLRLSLCIAYTWITMAYYTKIKFVVCNLNTFKTACINS
jgi:hypothetical protein